MEQQHIDTYMDGNDLYIRIRNCNKSLIDVVSSMLGNLISGCTQNVSTVPTTKDAPIKETEAKTEHIEQKFTFGPYQGMTPKEIWQKIGAKKAFCYFVSLGKLYYVELKNDVDRYINFHKGFLYKRLQVENPTYDDKMVFFTEYQSLFKEKLNKFLVSKGYNTLSDFLNCESEEDTTKMYREYIKSLLQ